MRTMKEIILDTIYAVQAAYTAIDDFYIDVEVSRWYKIIVKIQHQIDAGRGYNGRLCVNDEYIKGRSTRVSYSNTESYDSVQTEDYRYLYAGDRITYEVKYITNTINIRAEDDDQSTYMQIVPWNPDEV